MHTRDNSVHDFTPTSENSGRQEPRGGHGGGSGRGRGSPKPGRGHRSSYSDLQVYERYIIRQGGEIPRSRWDQGAKAALRPAYGAHVESITIVLRKEEHPIPEPEFSARNLNTQEKIEFRKMSMQKFDIWKKGAESRRDIWMTLLDRCTQQVRKALLAAHLVEVIESLECRVMDFMTWLRKVVQDLSMSTYMRMSKAMSDYTMAKQFLFEIDEAWSERVERLANAIEETGGVRPIIEKVGNKFIMSSDASRHSEAVDRHEEHLNMLRTIGISDPVWRILTQPVASVKEALLKLK